jgi:P4 family phage/plasmid primase-like protien
MNTKVNIYKSVQEKEPIREVEVFEVYKLIGNGAFKEETEKVLELERARLEGKAKEDDVNTAKRTIFKAASFSGSFPRSGSHAVEDTALCTGLINLDIDDENDAESLERFKNRLHEIQWIEACWLSATGGVTGYLSVNARIELLDSLDCYPQKVKQEFNGRYDLNRLYGLYHKAINAELSKYGVQASEKAKDIKRLRCLSYDQNIYVNEKCSTFTVEMLAKNLEAVEATIKDSHKESPFKDFIANPKEIKAGERNSTLFGVGCYLSRQGKICNSDLEKEITRINEEHCKPCLEMGEVKAIVKSVLSKRKQEQISKLDFPLTELGNAERFVAQYGNKIRYCIDNKEWYIYDGKRWEKDEKDQIFLLAEDAIRRLFESADAIDDGEVAEAVRKHARASESLNKLKAMMTLSSTQLGIPIRLSELDSQEYLVNVNNGTLDLRTKTLHPHDRKDLISRLIPLDYDPNLKSELWERTLGLILKPEAISFMQRILGYCLTGSTKEQKMFILYGTGANGKTTILRTVTSIMKEYGSQSSINTFLEKKNDGILNDLARLQDKRLTLIPEYDESKKLSEALIKNVTGGDAITCRFLFCEYVEFVPKFKIIMATNHKPVIGGSDYGIKRRIIFVPFEYTIPTEQQNPKLMEELQGEYSAILSWLAEGAYRWYQEELCTPQFILDETAEYLEENDLIDRFLSDVCLLSDSESIQSSLLFEHFKMWREINNESDLSQKTFSQKLIEKGYKRECKNHCRFFKGVSINPFSVIALKVEKQREREKAEELRRAI